MSGNHFLRSMAEPVSHEPEKANIPNEVPEVHFADTVSVVTEVNKVSEAPLVDIPLELTTKDDTDAAKANEQIRRSASRDRDMRDEEGLVLKSIPREASEDPPTATAEVAEGVEKLEISVPLSKKRKSLDETEQTDDKARVEAANLEKIGMKILGKTQPDEALNLVPGDATAYLLRRNLRKNSAGANEESRRRLNESALQSKH
ncbi:hypothetical protein B0J17DRAFT_310083 [Rhizoctonia solani]|nr:hypothetical protein B0J17DRAFT_310083 [Rhizoctonia solani]